MNVHRQQLVQRLVGFSEKRAAAGVDAQRHLVNQIAVLHAQPCHVGDEHRGQVVHAIEPHILQRPQRLRFSGARKPRHHHQLHLYPPFILFLFCRMYAPFCQQQRILHRALLFDAQVDPSALPAGIAPVHRAPHLRTTDTPLQNPHCSAAASAPTPLFPEKHRRCDSFPCGAPHPSRISFRMDCGCAPASRFRLPAQYSAVQTVRRHFFTGRLFRQIQHSFVHSAFLPKNIHPDR